MERADPAHAPDVPATAPRLELVVAVARNGVIGRDNDLPWRLPADLARFKRITMGRPMLMGRRTWDSIGRPLPGRASLVLTRQRDWRAPGAQVVHDLDAALTAAGSAEALMIIGGADLFRATLPRAAVIHLTEVHADVDGDVWFPGWERLRAGDAWRETTRETHAADERHAHAYAFVTLERA